MRRLRGAMAVVTVVLAASVGFSYFQREAAPATAATQAAAFVSLLDDAQKAAAVLPFDGANRFDWHFIPKPERKGLQLLQMKPEQRDAALALLRTVLSDAGFDRARKTMANENLIKELEAGRGTNIRDPERYYFTLFGTPGTDAKWGLSVEGHHLSVNFVMQGDKIISSTPQAFCANPAIVKANSQAGMPVGTRIIELEETLAFELVKSLSDAQKPKGIIAERAPREVRDAGTKQPPQAAAEGIVFSDLNPAQQALLRRLISENCAGMTAAVREDRLQRMERAGFEKIKFAWAGATEPGIGHYYKIQGPSFLIEFVNTQADSGGNPANHIHCVFRDMQGDFGVPLAAAQ